MWFKRKVKIKFYQIYTIIYGWFHPIEPKVLFESYNGKQYSDSERAISEELHRLYPEYTIVWKLNSSEDKYGIIPDYIKKISGGKEFYKQLATSLCYITNEPLEPDRYRRKNQFFIQTWHGDRGMKVVLNDFWKKLNKKRPIPIADNKYTSLCVAASDYGENIYRNAFGYNGEILKIGMPRNDKLVINDKMERETVKNRINIPSDVKVLLYAPTFRDKLETKQDVQINFRAIIEKLNKKGDKWVVLMRAHSSSKGINSDKEEFIIDVTKYPDMTDLLLISDMLITDYSSCAGDFIIMDKPVILTIFDKKEYEENCRELYYLPEDAGYIIANNQQELENIIENNTKKDYIDNCKKIRKYYNVIETGKSSKEICTIIKNLDQHKK